MEYETGFIGHTDIRFLAGLIRAKQWFNLPVKFKSIITTELIVLFSVIHHFATDT